MMQWLRIRHAEPKHLIAMERIDIPSAIRTRMIHEAKANNVDTDRDELVFMRRNDDWYVEFGLDVNPPAFVVKKLHDRGWKTWNSDADHDAAEY